MVIGHLFMIQEIRKIANNTELKEQRNNHLSIQFSLDGFSFCILKKDSKEFTDLCDYFFEENQVKTPQKLLTNIADVFDSNELLKQKFSSVSVGHINDVSTLVPKPLFDENKLSTYVEFNNKVLRHDYFVYDEINNHDIVNVYAPYVNVNNFLIDQFGGFEYKHFSTVLVENLTDIYKYSLAPQMFVNICKTHFEIIVIFDKKLQLYNTFKYNTKEDFIYYILFTAEQLKMNPEKFELQLLGNVVKDDELYSMAYKYVRNVSLLENRSRYSYSEDFTEEIKRKYFTLLHQF